MLPNILVLLYEISLPIESDFVSRNVKVSYLLSGVRAVLMYVKCVLLYMYCNFRHHHDFRVKTMFIVHDECSTKNIRFHPFQSLTLMNIYIRSFVVLFLIYFYWYFNFVLQLFYFRSQICIDCIFFVIYSQCLNILLVLLIETLVLLVDIISFIGGSIGFIDGTIGFIGGHH